MFKRSVLFSLLVLVFAGSTLFAYDRSEFLFLDEIEMGMTGIGKTIIANDVIEEFSVEVLGIIDQPGTGSDFIVVRVSGDVIGRAGGIAQGMSGSPIYVDGKLIGALSRAANWSKAITPIGLVTPIEQMLEVLDIARSDTVASAPSPDAILADAGVANLNDRPTDDLVAELPNVIFSYPVSTALVTSGLSGRSLDILMSGLSSRDLSATLVTDVLDPGNPFEVEGLASLGLTLSPVAGSAGGAASDPAALVPGGSVGVALASGDVTIGSLGTVTYRDGDTLVGYGHPFISNGASQFPLTGVSIIDTMKSLEASFKLGTIGEPLGTILEDRSAAIGGRVGPIADLIDVSLGVRDADRGVENTYSIGLVDEPRLVPGLLLSSGFEAIDSTLDRIGQGTVEVTYQILGDNMPDPLERKDIFFSSADVAVYAPWQLASIVSYLQYNAFEDPKITRVAASMQITQEIKGIQITGLSLDSLIYVPGGTIHYEVRLQTFQGESQVVRGSLEIPSNLSSDFVVVRAYGGPRYLEDGEAVPEFTSLQDIIQAIEEIPSYETLTVELFAADLYAVDPTALYGVTDETRDFPGYAVYDQREVTVPVWLDTSSTSSEAEGTDLGPGW